MLQKCTTSDNESVPLDHLGHTVHGFVNAYRYDPLYICIVV